MKLSVQHNFPAVERQLRQLQEDVAKQAMARAINRTLEQASTSMSKEIRAEFNISAAKVRAALRVNKASYRGGLFSIQGSLESPSKKGRSLNVINFGARPSPKGVSVLIKKGGGRRVITGAFIANDNRTVFVRTGKTRLPIKAVQTIDVAQMFNTRRINAKVVSFMQSKFPEIFAREAKFYTDRFNQRGRA